VSGDLLLAVSPGELWAALVEGGEATALRVFRATRRVAIGEVILGRIVALRPDLPAALVDIGQDRPGFLSAEDAVPGKGIAALHEGQAVIVQVVKEPRADKAAGLSMRPRLAGRHAVLRPTRPGQDWEARGAAASVAPDELAADLDALRRRWQAIETAARSGDPPARLERAATPVALALGDFATGRPDRIIVDDRAALAEARAWLARHQPELLEKLELHPAALPLFEEHGVAGEIAAALAPRVGLPGGGALTIETTAAATLIDVDSGGGERRGKDAAASALAVNLAAAHAIARHIRLRNLAGPIIIDFVGMRRREQRDRVRGALAEALAGDGDSEILGWTRIGHMELVRKRRQAPLGELLFEYRPGGGLVKTPLTVALEALRSLLREAEATPGRAPRLHLHPEVAAALEGEAREGLRALETRLGRPIALIPEPGRPRDSFDIRLA